MRHKNNYNMKLDYIFFTIPHNLFERLFLFKNTNYLSVCIHILFDFKLQNTKQYLIEIFPEAGKHIFNQNFVAETYLIFITIVIYKYGTGFHKSCLLNNKSIYNRRS